MKHIFLIAIIIGLGILTRAQAYQVSNDGSNKILKGLISRDMLEGDTAFKWFHENQSGYTPDAQEAAVIRAKAPQVQFLVFGGTWCDDTKHILPKFFSLLDAASFSRDQVTLVGVDRDKKAPNHLSESMHITSIPTFIVLKDGQEVGRVVADGKVGRWDKELSDIIAAKF
ncbi:MAG TPA: thioredoxin family protein [Puia sp.]|nr:thioredoxin family protein [Puia sp.]